MNDMKDWRWKNHYIDLIDQNRDRIFSTATQADLNNTKISIQSLRAGYDEFILELGSGSGGHIIVHAEKNPRTLFVGVEMRYKRAFRTLEKAQQLGITNLFMVQGDARKVIDLLEDNQLNGLYINFPDPWEKKRWQKHRLISASLLEALRPKLVTGGFFSHKTDHAEYFARTLEAVQNVKFLSLEDSTNNLHGTPKGADLVKTEFEKLFISKGLPVHYLFTIKK